jgi:hypothetical protein
MYADKNTHHSAEAATYFVFDPKAYHTNGNFARSERDTQQLEKSYDETLLFSYFELAWNEKENHSTCRWR